MIKNIAGGILSVCIFAFAFHSKWERMERRREAREERRIEMAEIDREIEKFEMEKASAPDHFRGSAIKVNKIYNYTGPTHFEPYPETKLIAAHVEFRNVGHGANFSSIYAIDPDSGFISDDQRPDIAGLRNDGLGFVTTAMWPESRELCQCLLIFQVPKSTRQIKLSYWGIELAPATLIDDAAALPLVPKIEEVKE